MVNEPDDFVKVSFPVMLDIVIVIPVNPADINCVDNSVMSVLAL